MPAEGKGRVRITLMPSTHHRVRPPWAILGGMRDQAVRLLHHPSAPDAIELRHLRSFVAVAEELNFGRAATRLFLSQPALSRQIRALERIVGCQLLRRSTHVVELTLAGEALLGRTRSLLGDLDDAIVATRSVGDEAEHRATALGEPMAEHTGSMDRLPRLRTAYEAFHAQFPVPGGVDVRAVNAGGVPCLLATPDADRAPTVLLLHGGGYILRSAFGYRPLAGALAVATGSAVLVPDYRLAPEHPYPAAIDDAQQAYQWMLDSGTDPRRVTVVGDSTGGGLAMALLIRLERRELPQPGRAALLSPGLDLLGRLGPRTNDDPDMRTQVMLSCAAYFGGEPPDDPDLSPFTADLSGLPPLIIQAGTGEYVLDEARQLAEHAATFGVDARLDLYPVKTHVFHVFWSFLPAAAEALESIARFIDETGSR